MTITVESHDDDGYVSLTGDVGRLEIHDRLVAPGDHRAELRVVCLGRVCQARVERGRAGALVGRRVELAEE